MRGLSRQLLEQVGTTMPMTQDITDEKKSKLILLAEDSITTRLQEKRILESAGYEVIAAVDGFDAWSQLSRFDFDAVVSDIMMPVMDGLTALRLWRERESERNLPRTTVLMVTAHAMTGDRERFIAAGADGYVSKPMSELSLRKEINRACLRNAEGLASK